jgi:hypothetical protein
MVVASKVFVDRMATGITPLLLGFMLLGKLLGLMSTSTDNGKLGIITVALRICMKTPASPLDPCGEKETMPIRKSGGALRSTWTGALNVRSRMPLGTPDVSTGNLKRKPLHAPLGPLSSQPVVV